MSNFIFTILTWAVVLTATTPATVFDDWQGAAGGASASQVHNIQACKGLAEAVRKAGATVGAAEAGVKVVFRHCGVAFPQVRCPHVVFNGRNFDFGSQPTPVAQKDKDDMTPGGSRGQVVLNDGCTDPQ